MKPFSARTGRRLAVATLTLLAAVAAGVLAFAGSASSKTATLAVGKSIEIGSKTESIAVTPKGAPVYELSPETVKHLLCSSSACLGFWPPVKVAKGAKLTKGAGLRGTLGTLKRKGFTQLTLSGHPLYTFSQDKKKGEAHGEGIKAFGGTWHVFKESGAPQSAPPGGSTTFTTSSTTQTPTSTNPYGY